MSSSMMLPKPWQVGHAPNGLLNENSRGCGSRTAMPHVRHSKRSENRCDRRPDRRRSAAGPRSRTPRRRLRGTPSRSNRSAARAASPSTLHAIDDHLQRRPVLQRARRRRRRASTRLAVDEQPAEALAPQRRRASPRRDRRGRAAPAAAPRRRRSAASPPPSPSSSSALRSPRHRRRAATTGMSNPISSRVPSGSVAEPARDDFGGFAHDFAGRSCGRTSGRRARRAAACSRGSRWSCRPSSADCGCCSSAGWRSPGRCRRCESTSGFSIRSRNWRA